MTGHLWHKPKKIGQQTFSDKEKESGVELFCVRQLITNFDD